MSEEPLVTIAPSAKPVLSVLRVSDVPRERVPWLWRDRLPFGKLVTLDGMPGLGKSTVTTDIAARVSTGRPMPGETIAWPAASVVMLSAEDGIGDTIRPRLEAAGADLERIFVLDEIDDGKGRRPLSIPEDLPYIAEVVVREHATLLTIDPIYAFLSSQHDSYRDQDVRRALHQVKLLAEQTRATVVAVRHPTKGSQGASSIYAGGGSIGVIGAARVGLFMGRDPDDDTRVILAVAKSNLAAIPPSLAIRLVQHPKLGVTAIAWDGESDRSADQLNGADTQTARDEAAVEILDMLAGRRLTQDEIIRARRKRPKDSTTRRALAGLLDEGDIDLVDGTYGLVSRPAGTGVTPTGVTQGLSGDTDATMRPRAHGYVSCDTTTIQAMVSPDTPPVTPDTEAAESVIGDTGAWGDGNALADTLLEQFDATELDADTWHRWLPEDEAS